MTIYVHSRGKSQEHDHSWLKVEEGSQISMIPKILRSVKPEELIDSQKPSIILARSGGCLVLLATALTTKDGRTDFMRRQICNSVAWVEPDTPTNERVLCKIAAQALNGKLDNAVDSAVSNDAGSLYGFRAELALLKNIGNNSNDQDNDSEKYNSDADLKVGKNSEPLKSDLAEQLTKHGLPEHTGGTQLLVVVTTLKSFDGLTSKNVWRGLSSRIESEDWEKYPIQKKKAAAAQKAATTQKSPITGILILLIIGLVILAILIPILSRQGSPPEGQTTIQSSVTSLSKMEIAS